MSRQRPPAAAWRAPWRRTWRAVAAPVLLCLLVNALAAASAQSPPTSASGAAIDAAQATADRDTLLDFVSQLDNWQLFRTANNLTGWTNSSATACGWKHIQCDADGEVAVIDFTCEGCARQLEGTLPAVLANLSALTTLELGGNSFQGSLPASWGANGSFPALLRLDVNSNALNGTLPAQWGNPAAMPALRYLNVSYNGITGGVPESWLGAEAFTKLMSMDLASNNMTGPLDDTWAAPDALPALSLLSLAGNSFDGSLPLSWQEADAFPRLTEMDLSRNNFNGTLPQEWGASGSFPNLTALSLYANQLDGELPLGWGQAGGFSKLHSLYLDTNFLTGSLPPEWAVDGESWPKLKLLGLSSNELTGTLPANWGGNGSFPALQQLFLSYNKLSGTVPESWASIKTLQDLWLRPANMELCGSLPANINFTVCQISGSTCIPIAPSNFSSGCGQTSVDSSVIEVVVRVLGYNLVPFDAPQQVALQDALDSVMPSITSPENVTILNVQQASDPIVNVAEPLIDNDQSGTAVNATAGAPPRPSSATTPAGLGGNSTGAAAGRRLLSAASALYAGEGGAQGFGGQGLGSQGFDRAGGARRGLLGRRGLLQAVPAAEVFAANDSPLQAVDVTMNIQAGTMASAVSSDLVFVVSGSSGLLDALQQRGVNATETQLLFSSGSPIGPALGPGAEIASPPGRSRTIPSSSNGNSRAVELTVGIVSGTVVAALLAALVGICLLWRRAQRRRSGRAPDAANGRWAKMASIFSKNGSERSGAASEGSAGSGAATPPGGDGGRGLVFPPLNIAETGIDIDMDNLFRSAGANSEPGSGSGAQNGIVELPRVPFSDWEIRPEDIEICRRPDGRQWEIGTGAFGQVYKAVLGGVQTVAVKMLGGQQDHAAQVKFCREVAILRSCRASNVVQFQGACVAEGCTMLVTEFMEGGDLWRIMARDKDRAVFGWYRRGKQVALDVAAGLHWLHTHRIVHFDLKSQNILLARDGTAKIADVGLARILNRDYVTSLDMAGTFAWAAPELLLGARCTEKVDIFSFGVVLWELVTGERPLRGQTRELRVPEECPAEVDRLIAQCMHANPAERPSAKEIHEALMAIEYPPAIGRVPSLPPRGDSGRSLGGKSAAAAMAAAGAAADAAVSGKPSAATGVTVPVAPAAGPAAGTHSRAATAGGAEAGPSASAQPLNPGRPGRLSPVESNDGSQAAGSSMAAGSSSAAGHGAAASAAAPATSHPASPSDGVLQQHSGAEQHSGSGNGGGSGSGCGSSTGTQPAAPGTGSSPTAIAAAAAPPKHFWQRLGANINPFGAPDQQRSPAAVQQQGQQQLQQGSAANAAQQQQPQPAPSAAAGSTGREPSPFAR